jgi:hypothetical protein
MRQHQYVVVVVILFLLRFDQLSTVFQRASASKAVHRYERTFTLGPSPILTLENSSLQGTVRLEGWDRPEIRVTAEIHSPTTEVDASADNGALTIKLRHKPPISADPVHFVVSVPRACEIELSSMSGAITVRGVHSRLKARTVDGDISLTDVSGQYVDARSSTNGSISLSSKLTEGRYNIYSGGGTIDVTFPESASFILDAATHEGRIEMDGFDLKKNEPPTPNHVEGTYSSGQAILNLSTHRGQIRLRKR